MVNIPELRISPNVMTAYTARRELEYDNEWVVRDRRGTYIVHNLFRSKLFRLYPHMEVVGI